MRRERLTQRAWVQESLAELPAYIAAEIQRQHALRFGMVGPHSTSPFASANQWLIGQRNELLASNVGRAYDESLIRDVAESYARACAEMPQLARREQFALAHDIEPPPGKFLSDRYEPRGRRLADPLWWRRRLRARWLRRAEEGLRRAGVVRKGKCAYASDSAVDHRGAQKRRMRAYCEAHVAINEIGEQLSLFDLQQHSVSNPALRRGEFMTRVRGFEELATARRDEALFFTLTTPSHFHPQLAAGGANPAYDGQQTVRSAQQWLCKCWSRFRAAIHRRRVLLYGFRIAEPHHDGTPHWHGLLFCKPADVAVVEHQLRKYWLRDHGDDPGAREHRVQFVRVDATKGSAAGYIAKYVSKNIDGTGAIGDAQSDEADLTVASGVQRVDAWAATHGIRQFQQIGGPPVALWRESRRLREPVEDVDIERARTAADKGRYKRFVECCGGITVGRRTHLRLLKEEMGQATKYGECRGATILGLRYASSQVITRPHQWRIERKGASCPRSRQVAAGQRARPSSAPSSPGPSDLGPVAITVRPTIPGSGRMIQGRYAEMALPTKTHPAGYIFVARPGHGPPAGAEKSDHLLQ